MSTDYTPPETFDHIWVDFKAYAGTHTWIPALVTGHDHMGRINCLIANPEGGPLLPRVAVLHESDPAIHSDFQRSNERDQTGGVWRHTELTRRTLAALAM